MKKIFIDGSAGTTGLKINERLRDRDDIHLMSLPEEKRKIPEYRRGALNACDVAFLCLPDAAAKEAVSFVDNPDTVIIDTSTAHRTSDGWIYGFPELGSDILNSVKEGKRITVPGCHASGFIALVYPLIKAGILPVKTRLTCHSVTGYSGGGKKMIAEYKASAIPESYLAPRQYGLDQEHKHLPEMQKITGLETPPAFCPIVSGFYSGMSVSVPLFKEDIKGHTADDIRNLYREKYIGPIVKYQEKTDEAGFIPANIYQGLDIMTVSVYGNADRILLIAAYDNLGKGASGAAVECLNLLLGEPVTKGLFI